MELRHPGLFLLALLPALTLTLLAARGSAVGLVPWRWRATLLLRLVLVSCLALALGGAEALLPSGARAVVFALDVSESITPATRRHLFAWARRAWEARAPEDRVGLVVFGSQARLEQALETGTFPAELPSLEGLPRERTALDAALRLAGGLLRGDPAAERRVVLISDGNGPAEPALREARVLGGQGVSVTPVVVELTPSPREVLLGEVSAPPLVAEGEPFLLKVEVVAQSGGRAALHVSRDDGSHTTQEVELAPGSNVIAVSQRLQRPGASIYQVAVAGEGDGNPANDVGGAIVQVRGRPRVLLLQGPAPEDGLSPAEVAAPLREVLLAAGFEVDVRGPGALPLGLDDLAGYAAVILGSVGAEHWTEEQLEQLRRWVFDQGGGLLALGGPESFGLGGYYRTPLEEALPLASDLKGKKALPSLALVLCLDHSGSMLEEVRTGGGSKLELAKEGALRTLGLLQPFDRLGILAFSNDASWLVPLTEVRQPEAFAAALRRLEVGGGTEIGPALQASLEVLARAPTRLRHAVLLTDGRSAEDPAALRDWASRYQRAGVTLTTVGVGEEIDQRLLLELAHRTGGRFLWARDASTLPRLLSKEAGLASQALLVERSVTVRAVGDPGAEVDWSQAPPLKGFVMTAAKPEAEVLLDSGPGDGPEDGPILARWRYGLGKSAAFTSDAAARWCAPWLEWSGYPALFAGLVRWVARDPHPPGLETQLELSDGRGQVRVTAQDAEGRPINGLALWARVSGPRDGASDEPLALTQSGPGSYEARFEAARPGAWFVTVERREGEASEAAGSAGAVLAYPREYRDLKSDPGLLGRIAAVGRGELLTLDHPPEDVFAAPVQRVTATRPLLPLLLVAAGVLLLLEVTARRLVVPDLLPRRAEAEGPGAGEDPAGSLALLRAQKEAEREARRRRQESERAARQELPGMAPGAAAAAPATTATVAEPPPAPAPPTPPRPAPAPPAPAPRPASSRPPEQRPRAAPPPAEDGSAMSKLLEAKRKARGGRPPDKS